MILRLLTRCSRVRCVMIMVMNRCERIVVTKRGATESFRGGSVDVLHRDSCEFRVSSVGVFGGGDVFVVFVVAWKEW